ncbi:hypothetical protein BDV98DRAFT_88550 [Pterulicium gracile]|uniref:Uncharacterized protein n=1 Tax=Pterulicium gracile TaxID=1884261 RepID=A0A5C3QGD5_9AGAR|nr:hypothetical protein BDV98DRAFT_88550 [Pterula gracilis]
MEAGNRAVRTQKGPGRNAGQLDPFHLLRLRRSLEAARPYRERYRHGFVEPLFPRIAGRFLSDWAAMEPGILKNMEDLHGTRLLRIRSNNKRKVELAFREAYGTYRQTAAPFNHPLPHIGDLTPMDLFHDFIASLPLDAETEDAENEEIKVMLAKFDKRA